MNRTFIILWITIHSICAFGESAITPPSPKESKRTGYLSGATGQAKADSGTSFLLSGRLGFSIYQNDVTTITAGAFLAYSTKDLEEYAFTFVVTQAEVIAKGIQNSGFYAGFRAGLAYVELSSSVSGLNFSVSDQVFMYSTVLGYELPLSPALHLSFETAWSHIKKPVFHIAGEKVPLVDMGQIQTLLVGLTYQW